MDRAKSSSVVLLDLYVLIEHILANYTIDNSSESPRFLSFPWVVHDVLCSMKREAVEVNTTHKV